MDKTTKKFRIWRTVGMIAVTLAVIGLIVLTVFLVQKNDKNVKETVVSIGEIISVDEYQFALRDIKISVESGTADVKFRDNECLVQLTIFIQGIEKTKVSVSDFTINKVKYKSRDCASRVALDKGASKEIVVGFVVPKNSNVNLYLRAGGYKIPIGTTILGQQI